ncbi:MAG: hypothetical protein JW839_12715 [Candidatus Lokiarchaeota archaeon]|nr:hypothetical protein [Candidatus Lokiarchaeota archaeon]
MDKVFDFTTFQEKVFPEWVKQFKVGPGIGDYSFAPGGTIDSYGTADTLISMYIMDELGGLTEGQRDEWAATINQFQDPATCKYRKDYARAHFWEHTTAYCTCALHLIDRKPAHPMAWKDAIIKDENAMLAWTRQWRRGEWSLIWSGSHVWSGVPATLAMTGEGTPAFFDWYFAWFDKEADPETGFWRRGWRHRILAKKPHPHDMFGAFHMYYVYEFMGRKWPHPEKVVDWTLRFQQPHNGLWGPGMIYCRDLDGIYCLTRSSRNAGGYRQDDVRTAITRALATAEVQLNDKAFVFKHYPNSHKLTGALSAVAECQKFYPELVRTPRPWRQSIDKACYI